MISRQCAGSESRAAYLSHSIRMEANDQHFTDFTWILCDWSLLYDTTYSQGLLSDSFPLRGIESDKCTCQLSFKPKNLKNCLGIEFSDSSHFLAMKIQVFINNEQQFEKCYLHPVPRIIYPPGLKLSLEKKSLDDLLKNIYGGRNDKTNQIEVKFSISKIPEYHQSVLRQIPTTNVIRSSEALYEKKAFCDVTFVFDDKELPAHKVVLALRSEVFEAMFLSDMKEKDTSTVEIVDTKAEIFEEFLKYLYTGELNDLENKAEEMLLLADKYQVGELKDMCENFFLDNISEVNVIKNLIVADKYRCATLKKKATNILQINANVLKQAIMSESSETLSILKEVLAKEDCSPE
ncbi:BTB/POZ and MATH domain-containing protein 1-like [Venturia canescens]|uniref:BTB/POZ and MATH domain-containing protein 1-like n=1 Tax=Venturia canescens TaxID=32260 RepID=UPI001C9CFA08|nr:BTB/POZ and MATH domain-containing protein 1-like [Venturia canescens]XP_043287593.1 BTB/POZ and MATH domain-containing protein 1-like [Venturia canescens]XP_043287594.1 BTB/POZ and MATH domain-containing protein 1-like [Venturia canescens]